MLNSGLWESLDVFHRQKNSCEVSKNLQAAEYSGGSHSVPATSFLSIAVAKISAWNASIIGLDVGLLIVIVNVRDLIEVVKKVLI